MSALFTGLWPDQRFYLLALSQGQNRLFEGWRYGLQLHEIPGAPDSIDDWLQFIEPEKQLQAHSGQRRDSGRAAIFHGHGLGRDVEDERVVEYLRLLDAGVTTALRDTRPPLVLAGVEYVRAERFAGETKYPLKKMLKFALDGITSFSYLPLQLATFMGFVAAGLSIIGIVIAIILRISGSEAFRGQLSTLISVLFLGGIQLISLGIIGEYLGRIYDEVKGRPLYIVGETMGFDQEETPIV